MRTIHLLLAILLSQLTACTLATHEAHSGNNKWEKDMIAKIGGTASWRGADGSSGTTDDQDSIRAVATVAAGGIAGHFNTAQKASDNALTGLQGKQAVDKAQISATKAVQLGAQKPVITTPPQVVTFPPK